jgi:hypothetical protein
MINKIRNLLNKLLKRKLAKIPLTHSTTLSIYKIHTLKGDTYWIPVEESYRQLGPVIRHSYSGAILNPEIKVDTLIPWHQIDWLQEAGTVTI